MPINREDGGGVWRGPEVDDAESTHYRPVTRGAVDLLARSDESSPERPLFSSSHSMRMHGQAASWGLAAKIAAPILAGMVLCLAVGAYLIQNRVSELQFNDIKSRAYPVVRTLEKFGRVLLASREHFSVEHPEYDAAREWRVRDHWLVLGGFIGMNKWASIVGAEPGDVVPVERLENAEEKAALLTLSDWGQEEGERLEEREMSSAYILDDSGRVVAASLDLTSQQPGADPNLWRPAPADGNRGPLSRNGDELTYEYVSSRLEGNLLRVSAPVLRNAVNNTRLGTAVVIFRTDRLNYEQRGFRIFIILALLCLLVIMGLVCWLSARRVTVPLRRLTADLHAVAEGDLTRRSTVTGSDEIGLLAQAFNSMAERVRVARLNVMEVNRLDSDLAVARSIQNSLLPPQTPRIRGLDIFTSYRPAKEIGGDYYDFLPVDAHHLGIVIADASGKSIPAALVMSTTRAVLRFVAPGGASAAEILTRVNAILSVDIPRGMFVTAYYLVLNPLDQTMVCASAGHNPLLIGRADGSVELVNPGGIALGFDQGPIFQRAINEQRIRLAAGDRVLLYTDGVVECANIENEEYSDRRLQEFLRRHRDLSSTDFVGALLTDLDRHRGAADIRDDTTIVTFKVL